MSDGFSAEDRRSICGTFATVVRRNQDLHSLDPEDFATTMSRAFPELTAGRSFNLAPLWKELARDRRPEELYGVFFAFEQVGRRLGLSVEMPPALLRLSKVARTTFASNIDISPGDTILNRPPDRKAWIGNRFTPLPAEIAMPTKGAQASSLSTVGAAQRNSIANALVWAFKDSAVASRVNSRQLRQLVLADFDALCDGSVFQIGALFQTIREIPGVGAADTFIAAERMKAFLATIGLTTEGIGAKLPDARQLKLAEEADAMTPLSEAVAPISTAAPPRTTASARTPSSTGTGRTSKTKDLPGWRRSSAPARATFNDEAPKSGINVRRLIVLAVVALLVIGVALALKPPTEIEAPEYTKEYPLIQSRFVEETFLATLDAKRWIPLSRSERQAAIAELEKRLQGELTLRSVRIIGPTGVVMIHSNDGVNLTASAAALDGKLE